MKFLNMSKNRGFTLLETVIAIGVLAVLLTGFLAVFAPAAAGIRKSINVQEADRLASTLEQELVNLRKGQETSSITTGFDKAFEWIAKSDQPTEALMIYQYRASTSSQRDDGTAEPVTKTDGLPGEDYIVQPMLRRKSDPEFTRDLAALEGGVYLVKCTQLIFDTSTGELKPGTAGEIVDPKTGSGSSSPTAYPEAVIAFSAEVFSFPSRTPSFFEGAGFNQRFTDAKNPVFTRNLAVRR